MGNPNKNPRIQAPARNIMVRSFDFFNTGNSSKIPVNTVSVIENYKIKLALISKFTFLSNRVLLHKVEDSEAHLQTLPSTGYIFTIIGHRTQLWHPFWPLKTQSNESTSSRPHLGVPGLHADRVRCIPQGRRFWGRIPKLSHPNIASLSLGTPTSSLILTPYNPKQRRYTE